MNESIHKYFKVGTIQWMSYPVSEPLESLKKLCCDDYFDAIEIKGYGTEAENAKAKRLLEQSHLTVCYGSQPTLLGSGLNPNAIDEGERQRAEDALKRDLDRAEYFGGVGIAFLAGKWQEETKEQAFQQLLKTVWHLCDYAAPKGLMVELEAFDYDMDKASLMGPAPYVVKFAAEVRKTRDNFGILVDLSHFPTTYETSEFVITTLKPYITHLHFGNAVVKPACDAYGDKHPRLGYPNSANDVEELADFLRILKREGFFCPEHPLVLSAEVSPRPGEEEEIVLANTKRCLNRAWALV